MARYAVVEGQGMHASGSTVQAELVTASLETAVRTAARLTRAHRAAVYPGHTSGSYRVVATEATTRSGAVWLGHEIDRLPSVH